MNIKALREAAHRIWHARIFGLRLWDKFSVLLLAAIAVWVLAFFTWKILHFALAVSLVWAAVRFAEGLRKLTNRQM